MDCSLAVIRNKERFGTYITRMGITLKTGMALRLLEKMTCTHDDNLQWNDLVAQ